MLTISIKMEHVWKKLLVPFWNKKEESLVIITCNSLILKFVTNLILLLRCGPTDSFKTKPKAQTYLARPKMMVPLK